jgi:hypothetical protein
MVAKIFPTIKKILHGVEDHLEEWRRKEREKLLAKTIGEEEARRASVGEGAERHRFVFVVHSEEAYKALVSLAGERYRLVNAAPGGGSTGSGVKGSWLVFEAAE